MVDRAEAQLPQGTARCNSTCLDAEVRDLRASFMTIIQLK